MLLQIRDIFHNNLAISTRLSGLNVLDGALQRRRKVEVEKRAIDASDNEALGSPPLGDDGLAILAGGSGALQALDVGLDVVRVLSHRAALDAAVELPLGVVGGRLGAADFGDAEHGLPAPPHLGSFVLRHREAEACSGEGALRPSVVDRCEVPLDGFWRGVAVELVPDVDKVLDTRGVHVVD